MARLTVIVQRTQALAGSGYESEVIVERGALLDYASPVQPGARLRLRPFALPEGARVRTLAKLSPTQQFHNQSPHPPWPQSEPLAGRGQIPGPGAFEVISTASSLRATIGQLRQRLRMRLKATLTSNSQGLALALLLGDRSAVDRELRDVVSAAGLSHVLAVSGLHVSIMAGLIVLFIRLLLSWTPRLAARINVTRLSYAIGIPVALSLSLFCGAGPSAKRAAITAAIAWAVHVFGARARATSTLSMATLVLSAHSPSLALSPGFLLSIAATSGVLHAAQHPMQNASSLLRASLQVSIATSVATAPIILWCFGQLPIAGLFANLVAVPWTALVLMPLALIHGVISVVVPSVQDLSAFPFTLAANSFVSLSDAAYALSPQWSWPVPNISQGLLLTCLAALFLLRKYLRTPLLWTLLCVAALGLIISEWQLRDAERPLGNLRVTFVDVGQGDSALLDMPDGRLMLIDAGGDPLGFRDPGRQVLLPLLRARRRERIDVAVITHPHPDHYGGMGELVNQISIGEIWDSGQADLERDLTSTAKQAASLLDKARHRHIPVRTARSLCDGDTRFGKARVQVLWPCPAVDQTLSENDNSLVLLVTYGETRWLFAGDIEAEAEAELTARGVLPKVNVLKVPHHGSRTSSTESLLSRIHPRISIISAGQGNRFGHPHAQTLKHLQKHQSSVYSLAEDGSVILESNGRHVRLRTWSGRELLL